MTIQKLSIEEADTHLKSLFRYWDGILIPVTGGMFYDKKGNMIKEKSLFEIVFCDEFKNIPKDSNGIVIKDNVSMWALSSKRYYYLGTVNSRTYLYGINPNESSILISSVAKVAKIDTNRLQTKTKDIHSVGCLRELIHDCLVPLAKELSKSSGNKIFSIQAYAATDMGKHFFEDISKSLISNPLDGIIEPTFKGQSFMLKLSV